MSDLIWSAEDTSPAEIDAALRDLVVQRHGESEAWVPARVLNLVVVVDREWKGEVENRLERVGRNHASRTVVCAVDPERTSLRAVVSLASDDSLGGDGVHVLTERVELEVGQRHLAHLDTVVDPLVATDVATVLWSPHDHPEAVDALASLGQVVLLDSVDYPDISDALTRVEDLSRRLYVVDLAWLRSTPWRERVAASFDPHPWREELRRISAVTVRHHPDSGVAGMLLFGWLASRLGWSVERGVFSGSGFHGKAGGRRQEVVLRLESDESLSVPGLAGVAIETSSGMMMALDRAPGGLRATRRDRRGEESSWSVLGASRGEGGILGEGVRQALLRDPTYQPALEAARGLVG